MYVFIDEVLKQEKPITTSRLYLLTLARNGRFVSAKKLGKIWVIDEREARGEKLKPEDVEPCDLVTPQEYAKLHNCSYGRVIRRINCGEFKTAINCNGSWLLDKNDTFISHSQLVLNRKVKEANRKKFK